MCVDFLIGKQAESSLVAKKKVIYPACELGRHLEFESHIDLTRLIQMCSFQEQADYLYNSYFTG